MSMTRRSPHWRNMTKVRNCVLDALSINVNNIISLVVGTFPLDPTVSKTADILTILTAT